MELGEPLVGTSEGKSSKSNTYEVIQSLFFMVAFSTGLGILGSADSLNRFGIDSLLADFIVMVFVIITYAFNHHLMAYCCRESSEKFNYAEYIEDHFGKAVAMTYDFLMVAHNVILLSYIQRYIGGYVFGRVGYAGHDSDKAYYFLALLNIPLIFISLTSDFKKIKWFCIVLLLAWIYIFTGGLVETVANCTGSEYWGNLPVLSKESGSWIIKLIGLQLYFASAFQSLPFIYKEVKSTKVIRKVINYSAVAALIIYFSVYVFYTFESLGSLQQQGGQVTVNNSTSEVTPTTDIPVDPSSGSTDSPAATENPTGGETTAPSDSTTTGDATGQPTDTSNSQPTDAATAGYTMLDSVYTTDCGKQSNYATLTAYGLALAGACAIIVNVIPARFSLAQLVAWNDSEALKKVSAQDKMFSALLIMSSIILSLFMFNEVFWKVMICIGVILSSVLGIAVPPIAFLFTQEYHKLLFPHRKRPEPEHKNKNKKALIHMEDKKKKIFIIVYCIWCAVLSVVGIVAGFFIMTD